MKIFALKLAITSSILFFRCLNATDNIKKYDMSNLTEDDIMNIIMSLKEENSNFESFFVEKYNKTYEVFFMNFYMLVKNSFLYLDLEESDNDLILKKSNEYIVYLLNFKIIHDDLIEKSKYKLIPKGLSKIFTEVTNFYTKNCLILNPNTESSGNRIFEFVEGVFLCNKLLFIKTIGKSFEEIFDPTCSIKDKSKAKIILAYINMMIDTFFFIEYCIKHRRLCNLVNARFIQDFTENICSFLEYNEINTH